MQGSVETEGSVREGFLGSFLEWQPWELTRI